MKKLLAINIPTYKRQDAFIKQITILKCEIENLPKKFKSKIIINVFENPSDFTQNKISFLQELNFTNLTFKINETNIGGDENILQCCKASSNFLFTWVLGDDDFLVFGSLEKIINIISLNQVNLGLLIVGDGNYKLQPKFFNTYDNYSAFARFSIYNKKPHLLIAHTLISCNIFRTDIFNLERSYYCHNFLSKRSGLIANFTHMHGLIHGLLLNPNKSVILHNIETIDTKFREPSEVQLTDIQIFKIYHFYYLFLMTELGIPLYDVPKSKDMFWLFEKNSFKFKINNPILYLRQFLRIASC